VEGVQRERGCSVKEVSSSLPCSFRLRGYSNQQTQSQAIRLHGETMSEGRCAGVRSIILL
jgi:hypothetical protein